LAENGPEVVSDGARSKTETLPLKYQNVVFVFVLTETAKSVTKKLAAN
jgi:hypothetical protein